MRALAREVGFAVLAWLLPFVAGMALGGLRESHRELFESLIAVALATSTVLLGCIYLRRSPGSYVARATRIGVVWMLANLALDAPMFYSGPMQMSAGQYMQDIGAAYLMIPVITIGLGIAATTGASGKPALAA